LNDPASYLYCGIGGDAAFLNGTGLHDNRLFKGLIRVLDVVRDMTEGIFS